MTHGHIPEAFEATDSASAGGAQARRSSYADARLQLLLNFVLTSPSWREGENIPARYTCEGQDCSPPLTWTDPPTGTQSLTLISDDPDAPGTTWVHWVVYNLPASTRELPEGVSTQAQWPDGTRQGTTDFGRTGYGGPCPPSGAHRYFFKLYALDAMLNVAPAATKTQVEAAMKGHVLAQAQLMGIYRRKGR